MLPLLTWWKSASARESKFFTWEISASQVKLTYNSWLLGTNKLTMMLFQRSGILKIRERTYDRLWYVIDYAQRSKNYRWWYLITMLTAFLSKPGRFFYKGSVKLWKPEVRGVEKLRNTADPAYWVRTVGRHVITFISWIYISYKSNFFF